MTASEPKEGYVPSEDETTNTVHQEIESQVVSSDGVKDEDPRGTKSTHSHPPGELMKPVAIDLEATITGASAASRTLSVVPRSKRRGLLARFACIPEVEKPYEYSTGRKWLITALVALAAVAAPMGSSIFFPALPEIAVKLHTTTTITNLSVALYILSMGIFPLWWSSFSETLGRRTMYILSFALFTLWSIISAVSTSIGMLIVMRILAGGAAASVQAVGAGSIADIWEPKERGKAMGVYYLGPLLGPLLAPLIGGVLTQALGWRSTQWFQAIYGALIWIMLTLCLPETLTIRRDIQVERPISNEKVQDNSFQKSGSIPGAFSRPHLTRTSTTQSIQIKAKTAATIFKCCIIDPLIPLTYLRYPPILLVVLLASITFGSLYILAISVQATFSLPPYSYSTIILGLLYIPNALGYIISSIFGGRWNDRVMHRAAAKRGDFDANGKLILLPEDRMQENVWLAAAMYPTALIVYGWTAQKGVYWLGPMTANFFFGMGSMIVFGTATTMLTEMLHQRSSSGVAVNNFVRNILGCVGGVVAQPLIEVIGNGWLFTGLGIIGFGTAFGVTWAIGRWGRVWMVGMVGSMKEKDGKERERKRKREEEQEKE